MTTQVEPVRQPSADSGTPEQPPQRRTILPAGWPLTMAIAGYPVWWALGLTPLVFPIAAIPMAWYLRRQGRVRLPPGFSIWLMFFLSVAVSALALNVAAPDTLPPSGTGRYLSYGFRLLNYVAVTVAMLYVGNLSESVLPRLKVIRTLGVLCLWTILLGCVAVLFPHLSFSSPAGALLPTSVADLGSVTRVDIAQVQRVLGFSSPRPAAPFAFTNAWANNLSLLLVWFVVGWWVKGGFTRRVVATVVLTVAIVPIVYSLGRGMWIGLILSVLYVALRLAMRGRIFAIATIAVVLGVGAAIFVASPLGTLVSERLAHGHSDATRKSLASESLRLASDSPLVGFGSTRRTLGSEQTIAVGASKDCPKCGNRDIGSTGQLWLVLVAQGFVGAALYIGFFLRTLWAYRRDDSAIGIAGTLVILLSLFYGLFYNALIMPLAITLISAGLLWKNSQVRQSRTEAGGHRRRTVSTS